LITLREGERNNQSMGGRVKLKGISRYCCAGLIVVIAGVMLAGCKSSVQSAPAAATKSPGETYTSKALSTSFTGALNASDQLMLGMLCLEGSDNAITSEQAKTMLSLLRSLQGQALKSDAELNAVLAAIEAQLTPAQLSAISNMHLTQDDLQAWARDNAQGGGVGPGQGTPGAPPAGGGAPPASGGGARPAQMPTRQAQAGGAAPQEGGRPGANAGGGGPGFGQSNALLNSLIRLLVKSGPPTAGPAPAATP
jgi:hypothetical protein